MKYYLHQPFPADIDDVGKRLITRLKADINQNFELWSDLELQYGKHMARLGTMGSTKYSLQEELDIINDDLRDKLSVYIGGENKRAVFSGGDKGKFLTDIVKPEQHLRDFEQTEIQSRKNSIWNKTTNTIDFVTFNYTRTIETLLEKEQVLFSGFEIHSPVHVHGYYDSRMILGLNDVEQIDNENLRRLTYATDTLIKSRNNHSYGVAHTDKCKSLIHRAQLICCYGLSFGETDKQWWQLICNELRNRNDLIIVIFSYIGQSIDYSNNGHKMQYQMRRVIDNFITKGGIMDSDKLEYQNRIFVSIDDKIFDFFVL